MPAANPAGVFIVGPGTPYVTPEMLVSAPTGISWSTIPQRGATPSEQLGEQLNICMRATAMVDSYCNQPLRATVDTETVYGPGTYRCQVQANGNVRMLLSRSPVTSVVSGAISSATAFPPAYTTIAANQFALEKPVFGVYGTSAPSAAGEGGQAVLLAPGWVGWWAGRGAFLVQVVYINGWPHGSLTADAAAAATTITVDDITGWLGAAGNIQDNAGQQEQVLVTAVNPTTSGAISGPGTLTLQSGLTFNHSAGTLVTTLPPSVQQAAILFAVGQALTRGATATAVQTLSGGATGGGPQSSDGYTKQAQMLCHPYRRVT